MLDIEAIRRDVLDAVRGLNASEMNHRVAGQWSIAQVLEHLCLIEQACTKSIAYMLTQDDAPCDSKPIERAADRSHKVPAPEAFIPSEEQIEPQVVMQQLQHSREELMHVIRGVRDPSIWAQKSLRHPIIGRLNAEQWVEFVGYHEKRHLGQIDDIKRQLTTMGFA